MNSHFLKLSLVMLSLAGFLSACGGAIASPLPPAPIPHWWVVTASSDNTARVWDAASGETISVLQGHTGPVLTAAFSPNGKWVVTASDDKTARLWEAATGESLAVLSGHVNGLVDAVFSPDSKFVVTSGLDRTARVWNASTGEALMVIGTVHPEHGNAVTTPSFSPDGKFVVTAAIEFGPVSV
jgi:WD40 repeat protein